MKDNIIKIFKKKNYIIAALFAASALTFFLPLISIHSDFVEWSGSMKSLIGYANTLSKAGAFMGNLFGGSEYSELSSILDKAILLCAPYLLALFAAAINIIGEKRLARIAGIIVGLINIATFVLIALGGNAYLESMLGYVYYEAEFSIWKVLGIGFWLFLVLQAAAGIFCILSLGQGEEEESTEFITGRLGSHTMAEGSPVSVRPSSAPAGNILCVSGEYAGMQIPVGEEETIVIGRDAKECNLVVGGAKVSRRHCAISWFSRTNRYTLTDFSSNGTFYQDGKRIPPNTTVEIMPGTLIYLGDRENSFRIG